MPVERSNEYAATIIHSMETGEPAVIYGNVRNAGLLPGLPDGCCVEVPCLVDGTGLHPVAVPDYPPQLAALNRTYLNVVELTVRAVLEGRPDYVRDAAMLDPNAGATLTLDEIDALCDELTRAHGDADPRSASAEAIGARSRGMSGIQIDGVTKVYPNGVKAVDGLEPATSPTASSSCSSARRAAGSRRCCG